MTHGGLMSVMEAIHFGIPMVGIPLFADQHVNLKTAANKKIAVNLGSIGNVTEATLSYAINAVLYDDTYRYACEELIEIYLKYYVATILFNVDSKTTRETSKNLLKPR